ncbi:hypothetical protein IDH50_12860 [Aeromicrobium tamlense]|uniref:Uncharacterized protein n=1 Tax=Aeromicrobium tamlense TaxID=375541 RepID=A0A8I0FYW8_9ACTN|nr:hypothetical protein [Aeromicrobium tamlense]MBD1270740.1 hypothetical protein [Aeromicrobium tamlense]MBD1271128.1 hypothetical protein [Aeromicrobium tamlense]NYI38132.1 hypothetical protein [Aeromicrobium tamlense]
MDETYEFWIKGEMTPDLLDSFRPVKVEHAFDHTTLLLPVRDEPELFGVVARCEVLGLKILRMEKLS